MYIGDIEIKSVKKYPYVGQLPELVQVMHIGDIEIKSVKKYP
jgi:hypothetical protein